MGDSGRWVSSLRTKTNLRAALPLAVLSVELFFFLFFYFLVIVLVIEDSHWNFM